MDKKYEAVTKDDNSVVISDCLDMMWDDSITDAQLETLLTTVKSPKLAKKLAKYQYNQDVMRSKTVTNYVNVVQGVQEKISNIGNKQRLKEKKKFIKYQKLIADRSFFWPFSLPALTLCSVFFIALSISTSRDKNSVQPIGNYSEQYILSPQGYSFKDTSYIRVSTLDDISINFDANKLYSVNPNNQTKQNH